MMINKLKGKKVLIVGLGKKGFALLNFFNGLECQVRVTDIRPIFDLNKQVKRVKKIVPTPELTLGEHREEDFAEADVIVYSSSVDPYLPQLMYAREIGKQVYSEFSLAAKLCHKPIIAVCGSKGRTTIAMMVAFALKLEQKNVFVCGTSEEPFINFYQHPQRDDLDYVIVEMSPYQIQGLDGFRPTLVIYPNIEETNIPSRYKSVSEFLESNLKIAKNLTADDHLIVNFDKLAGNYAFRDMKAKTYWFSRKSFVTSGVISELQGVHFHDKRIQCNINGFSDYVVTKMRIVGTDNRENLMAAIAASKVLGVSDKSIQLLIERFPGIANNLEFVVEKNGVKFYNDSKAETMPQLAKTLESFKEKVILIAGGKEVETLYVNYAPLIKNKVRVLVLVGECKEAMNRDLGDSAQTYLVGSFDESVLIAYQKSRTGDTIVLCPGSSATDVFRDYVEKGSYFKKLVFQL